MISHGGLFCLQPIVKFVKSYVSDKDTQRQREMVLGSLLELQKAEQQRAQARSDEKLFEEYTEYCRLQHPDWDDRQIKWHVKGFMEGVIPQL